MVTPLLASVALKPEPVIVAETPGASTAGATAVMLKESAVAENDRGLPLSPATVAVIVFGPTAAPSVQLPTVATPEPFVADVGPVMLPPPLATANVTSTMGTPLPSTSVTRTEGGVGTVVPAPAD